MNESLTGRISRLISGSLNSLVDKAEGLAPETVMEEAIREIDSAIADVRTNLGKVTASKHMASKRLAEENSKHQKLAGEIELAAQQDRDDLAKAGISQQLDIEAQIPVLENTIRECNEKEKDLEGYITALQGKKREMQEELRHYRGTKSDAVVGDTAVEVNSSTSDVANKVEQATSTFDRVLEKETGVLPGSGATNPADAAKLVELEELSRQNRIEERLAAVKGNP